MADAEHENHVSEQDHVQENALYNGRQHEFCKDLDMVSARDRSSTSEFHWGTSKNRLADADGEDATKNIRIHCERKNDADSNARSVSNPRRRSCESPSQHALNALCSFDKNI